MGRLYFERSDSGDYHCRKCDRPVANLTGLSPEALRAFVSANPGKCIQVNANQTLRHE
jgi:hypothetical protein